MAILLTDLISWRDRLIDARLSGLKLVRDQFRSEVEYKSDSEMMAAIVYADKLIAGFGATPVNTIRFHTSKGL